MRTVWKYQIPVADDQELDMPEGAKIFPYLECEGLGALRVITFWAEVWPDAPKVTRFLAVRGTGHPIEGGLEYLGTARDDMFMWHLYGAGER